MFAAALAGLLATPAALAGAFEDAQAAFDAGDFVAAVGLWQPLAEQGNPDAQFSLGRMYLFGRGVPKDVAQAVTWLSQAADQGNTGAGWVLRTDVRRRPGRAPGLC